MEARMGIRVRLAVEEDIEALAALRAGLWPEMSEDGHRAEVREALGGAGRAERIWVAEDGGGAVCGFAEASIRREAVNGCRTSPVAFLEGIYVAGGARRMGVGRRLVEAVREWARGEGMEEIGSDAPIENRASQLFHAALGFRETERVVYFSRSTGNG